MACVGFGLLLAFGFSWLRLLLVACVGFWLLLGFGGALPFSASVGLGFVTVARNVIYYTQDISRYDSYYSLLLHPGHYTYRVPTKESKSWQRSCLHWLWLWPTPVDHFNLCSAVMGGC